MNKGKIIKLFVIVLTFCVFMTQGGIIAFAVEGEATTKTSGVPEGVILNYHETTPIDSSFANEAGIPAVYEMLPVSYSASANAPMEVEVREDHDAGVREQNPYGTCWAHAAMSVAESSYIINENVDSDSVDFNEYHLVHYGFGASADALNLFGNDYNSSPTTATNFLRSGGNNLVSLCMLASWHGASDVSQSVYGAEQILNEQTAESVVGYADAAHMENGYVLTMPDMSSDNYMVDMNIVKQMIMEYGSVAISYYAQHSPDYFQGAYQYCYDWHETDHAVTVIGWDDSISASRFKTAPPGDGAWIVKNSWGEDWCADGYFYLSYYDATIGVNAFAFDMVSGENYDNNYQYDGTGNFYGYARGNYGQIVGANAFVADSNETLAAVGFYTRSINNDYEIRIYRDLDEGANPNTGTLVWTQTGTETYVGYHTVELDENIPINAGERYAVVVTLIGDEDEYLLFSADADDDWGWVAFFSKAKAGESYVGTSVSNLEDLNPRNTDNHYRGKNIRIKAFTNERQGGQEVKVTAIELDHTTYEIGKDSSFRLTASLTPVYATNAKVAWSSSDESVATVDQYGNVTAIEKGTAVITATAQDGSGVSASCTVTVTKVLVDYMAIVERGEIISYYSMASVGNSTKFYAGISPVNATNKNVTWSSSNNAVAAVDEDGVVSAVSRGAAIITATAADGSGVSASCLVSVESLLIDTVTITLDGQSTDYIETDEIGKVYDFDTILVPEEAEMLGVKWESSNWDVASVDQNGKVTIKGLGDVVITASVFAGYTMSASCYIEVKEKQYPVECLDITYKGKSISEYNTNTKDEILDLGVTVLPENATNKSVTWSSSDPDVVHVYADGRVYIMNYGRAVITATAQDGSGVTDRITITSEPIEYKITFDGNGATSGNMTAMECKYDTEYILPLNTFTRDGVEFMGWNTHADGSGVSYTDQDYVKNLSDVDGKSITLYAQWNIAEYAISYALNGGKNHGENPNKYSEATSTIYLKDPKRTGYRFDGWYSDAAFKNKVTKIEKGSQGNVTLYAKWKVNKYDLKFNANGGSGKMSLKEDLSYTTYVTLTNKFTRKGYKFLGWAKSKDGDVVYTDGQKVKGITSSNGKTITLYAVWKKNEYKITYNLNNGKFLSGAKTKYTVTTDTFSLPKPTRTGYTFAGWYTDKECKKTKVTKITKGTTGSKTFYAKWTENKYNIKFNANGGAGTISEKKNVKYTSKVKLTNSFKRTGYTFAGWATTKDGSVKYTNGQEVSKLTSSNDKTITLYANWTMNKYNIKFDANGGKGMMDTQKNVKYTTKVNLTNKFTRKGYSFAGWATSKDGSVKYKNKQEVSKITSANGKTVTLYAKWTKNKYAITYNLNKGKNHLDNPEYYTVTTKTITLKNPTRNGYIFKGWYKEPNFKTRVKTIEKGSTGKLTLYAKWTRKK